MAISRGILKQHMVFGAMFTVLAAAGCGSDTDPDSDASPSNLESSSAAPTPDTDPASSTPSSPEAEESASTETHDESCQDGECEVSFTGSVEFPLDGPDGQWTIKASIEDDGARVELTKPDGMGGGGGLLYRPLCTFAADSAGGGGLSCAEEGDGLPEPDEGGIVVHLLERNGDTAVIGVALG